jgi:hypothetical protein
MSSGILKKRGRDSHARAGHSFAQYGGQPRSYFYTKLRDSYIGIDSFIGEGCIKISNHGLAKRHNRHPGRISQIIAKERRRQMRRDKLL